MAKESEDKARLPAHGASVLPSVKVDGYNLEIEDEEGFLGDKASKGAFWDIFDKWRKVLAEFEEDPFGATASPAVGKKKLAGLLAEGSPEQAAIVHSAI